jgi:hypothetical protein
VNIPYDLYPEKLAVPRAECETAIRPLGLRIDLPCTATADAYIAVGVLGVLAVAALWGAAIGIASVVVARGTALGRLAGFTFFAHWIDIETGAFPVVRSLRVVGLLFVPVALVVGFAVPLRSDCDNYRTTPKSSP